MGNPVAARAYGGAGNQAFLFSRQSVLNPTEVVVGGIFEGEIAVGKVVIPSKGKNDIFIGTLPIP